MTGNGHPVFLSNLSMCNQQVYYLFVTLSLKLLFGLSFLSILSGFDVKSEIYVPNILHRVI
jgi:hypothetical protein